MRHRPHSCVIVMTERSYCLSFQVAYILTNAVTYRMSKIRNWSSFLFIWSSWYVLDRSCLIQNLFNTTTTCDNIDLLCLSVCNTGRFGENCSAQCHCYKNESCNHVNGTCSNGKCDDGWQGLNCSKGKRDGQWIHGCILTNIYIYIYIFVYIYIYIYIFLDINTHYTL